MRLPEKSLPLDCHPASRVAKIKQRATSSKFTPPSNCQLSLRFYGEASSTIPATPYDDLRRERRDGTVIPFQRETSSLSWSRGYQRELSPSVHCSRRAQKRSRARFRSVRARIHYPWLRVHRRDRTREKDTFSREKLLSNAITICYGAVTAKRLNDDRHRCAYMLRTRACMCVYASLMRGEERKIERRKESGRSIDIDQLAGIGPRMRELIKPNH